MKNLVRAIDSWQIEAFLVAALLVITAYLSGGRLTDWIGAAAVFFTFMHGQVSFDFQESQEVLVKPAVPCYRWSQRYFVTKEVLWIVTFALLHAWPLLAGTLVFATYPTWRKWLRNSKERFEQTEPTVGPGVN